MQYSTNIKGLQQDINSSKKTEDTYSFVLNGTVENFSEQQPFPFISNTPSNKKCVEFKEHEIVIGTLDVPELNFSLLAVLNENTQVKSFLKLTYRKKNLGLNRSFDKTDCGCAFTVEVEDSSADCNIQELLVTSCFNWSKNAPVRLKYKITDSTFNLYFVNGLDQDRFVYFNLDDFSIEKTFLQTQNTGECDEITTLNLACDKTLWFPEVSYPNLKLEAITGGNKSVGKYNYLLAYSTNKGVALSPYIGLSQGINIFDKRKETVDKSVKVTIQNLDKNSRYKYYTLVRIETVKGLTLYKIVGTYPVIQTEVIDSDNQGEAISAEELLSLYPIYKNSKLLTVGNDTLFKGNLKEFEKFNLQPVINNVEVKWITQVLKEGDYADPEKALKYTSFLRDEVYALSIEPILSNLEKAPTFLLSSKAPYNALWQTQNTATKTFTNTDTLMDLEVSKEIYQEGQFAYWESTERYPNSPEIWGDLCGETIKHFKFPDHQLTVHHSSNAYDVQNYIFPIGVKITSDMNVIFDSAVTQGLITQEQRDRIVGWKLLRSNRLGNKSVIAKGLLYHMLKYERSNIDKNFDQDCNENSSTYYFPNYPYDDLNADPFLASSAAHYDVDAPNTAAVTKLEFTNEKRYTFHSPDTHFTEPDLGSTLKVEAEVSGKARGFFNIAEGQAEYKLLSSKHYNLALSLGKWIANTQKSPTEESTKQLFANIGGEAFGTGGATGKALGSLLGSFVGKGIFKNNVVLQFTDSLFKSSITQFEAEKLTSLIKGLMNYKKYFYQHQSVGKYNTITPVVHTREIEDSSYLDKGKHVVNQTFINNFDRESSVYLKLDTALPDWKNTSKDNSKILISDSSLATVTEEVVQEVVTCKKFGYSVVGTGTFSLWAKYCQPILITNPVGQSFPQGSYSYIKDSSLASFNTFNQRHNRRVYHDYDDNYYYTEEVLFYYNSDAIFGTVNNVPTPVESTLSCYQELIIKGFDRKISEGYDDSSMIRDIENLTIEEVDVCENVTIERTYSIKRGCECNTPTERNINSYYGSIKTSNVNQYGTVYDINWLPTGSELNTHNTAIFGGDTYISRFSLKRKHSFFSQSTFGLPLDFDINFSLVGNAAYPIYFLDMLPKPKYRYIQAVNGINFPISSLTQSVISGLFPIWNNFLFNADNYLNKPKYRLDCSLERLDIGNPAKEKSNELSFTSVEGLMYLYNYGIPYFLVETEINLDLRQAGKELFEDFYPNQSNLELWLQEKNVAPSIDNVYIYDKGFSKQPIESFHYLNDLNFRKDKDEKPTRTIHSPRGLSVDDSDYADIFIQNRAIDYHDFSKVNGALTSIDAIEGDRVLVRQENNSSIFNSYVEINTDAATAIISTGSLFKSKPVEFSKATLGYFGSQHSAILHTPYGHVSVDAKRGSIFLLGNNAKGLEELSNQGMKNWFKENLPFLITSYFPEVDVDNAFAGIGLILGYDSRFNSFYLTKLDYKPLDSGIIYNPETKQFLFNDTEIFVENKEYFCNKSWTVSYNFYTKQWQSFHSFTPNYYIDHVDHFDTGIKGSLWKHNVTNKDFQRYYGKLYPFIVETQSKVDMLNHIVKNVSFLVDVVEYFNDYDYIVNKEKSFSKAIVYNDYQNTGLLELDYVVNNLFLKSKYPILAPDRRRVLLEIKEDLHSFNQFKDIIHNTNVPVWKLDCTNVFRNLNNSVLDYNSRRLSSNPLRSTQNKVRLIQDRDYQYQFIFKGLFLNDGESRRF
jgi:hypothetical protein